MNVSYLSNPHRDYFIWGSITSNIGNCNVSDIWSVRHCLGFPLATKHFTKHESNVFWNNDYMFTFIFINAFMMMGHCINRYIVFQFEKVPFWIIQSLQKTFKYAKSGSFCIEKFYRLIFNETLKIIPFRTCHNFNFLFSTSDEFNKLCK